MKKNIVYIVVLLTLMFATLVLSSTIFSDKHNVEPWIDPENRAMLESLDPKLVDVLDKLFEQTPVDANRVERRLYIFPFLAQERAKKEKVLRIVRGVARKLRPNQPVDTLKSEWAINRFGNTDSVETHHVFKP